MHKLTLICALLAVPALSAGQDNGQVTMTSGFASNQVLAPGAYAPPFVPLVNTPSVTLDAAPASVAGASSTTDVNLNGTTNSTPSIASPAAKGPFATLTWYGPGTASEPPAQPSGELAEPQPGKYLDLGVGTSQSSVGVARLMAEQHVNRQPAARIYTNHDIDQLKQQFNRSADMVKHGNMTERVE